MKKSALLTFLLTLSIAFPSGVHPDPVPEQPVSLNFQNTEIDVVLKFFSDVTGHIFIKSDQVRGFVTVMSPGSVSPTEAFNILQAVLNMKGFTILPGPGKMLKVLTQEEAAQSELEVGSGIIPEGAGDRMLTQMVPLRFVGAQELKNQIGPLVSKGGNIIADDRMNSLVITDMASNIRRLMKIIASLDIRTPQVLIEALLMEVSLTNETKLGIEWRRISGFNSGDHHFTGDLSQSFDVPSLITEGLKYSVIRDDQNLSALIQALSTDQNVNILSTPHIMTLNNQPAVISVGEEVPILTQTRNMDGGDTIRSYDFKSVAIQLEVTPRVNIDREVFLKIHPSVKKIMGFNAELNAPILASREAQTSVLIQDGQTVVIGGLMKDDRSVSQSKIPLLGDIPLIGNFFKTKDTITEKSELLIFITPHVVLSPEEAKALTIKKESETKSGKTPYRMSARTHYQLGKVFYSEKKYTEALAEWETALSLSPDKDLRRTVSQWIKKVKKKMR